MTQILSFTEAADRVKQNLDIVDIISRNVILKKAGRNYLGLCPFHPEKTPSFNVNREKNLFKCFGCGEAGDAIKFLMSQERKTYGEVIRDLAEEMGITIQDGPQALDPAAVLEKRDFNKKILALNEAAQQQFQTQLQQPEAQTVRDYLAQRKITPEIATRFGLGYAKAGWQSLTDTLLQLDIVKSTPDILVTAGLAVTKQDSNHSSLHHNLYDKFRDRLMIPIWDDTGRLVAFGGRTLKPDDKPKYMNSPETPVYSKSRVLYGLMQAKDSIRQSKSAVVMEGYFDVITAHCAGVTQAVGSCGTALTEQHLKLLTRYGAETVHLAFDSDEAGLKAALSAIQLIEPYLKSHPLQLKVLTVPDGKDPDAFIGLYGADAFADLLSRSQPYLDFKFEMALRQTSLQVDLKTREGRIAGVEAVVPLLVEITQPVTRSEYIRQLAERLKVSIDDLSLEVRRVESQRFPTKPQFYRGFGNQSQKVTQGRAISKPVATSLKRHMLGAPSSAGELKRPLLQRHMIAEKSILQLLLMCDDSVRLVIPMLTTLQLNDPTLATLAGYLKTLASLAPESFELTAGSLRQRMPQLIGADAEQQRVFADLAFGADKLFESYGLNSMESEAQAEKILGEANNFKRIIEEHQRHEALKRLADRANQMEKTEDDQDREVPVVELQYQLRDGLKPK